MVDDQLKRYVQTQLKRGFSKPSIRSAMLRYGYPEPRVDAALKSTSPPAHHIGLIIFMGLLLSMAGVVLFFLLRSGDQLPFLPLELQMMITPETPNVRPGGVIEFILDVKSDTVISDSGRVQYAVVDVVGNSLVSKEEVIRFDRAVIRDSLPLPHSVALGDYTLTARVRVGDSSTDASTSFSVVERGAIVHIVEEKTSLSAPSYDRRVKDIITLAEEDAQAARSLCLEFADREVADQCLLEAGLTVNNEIFCPSIEHTDRRDSCYFNLVLITGKAALCSDIANDNLRSTCALI